MQKKLKEEITIHLKNIDNCLIDYIDTDKKNSLFYGSAGASLFRASYLLKTDIDLNNIESEKYLNKIFSSLQTDSELFNTYSICLGYSGLIWYYNYMVKLGLVDSNYLDEVEDEFLNLSLKDLNIREYDYLHGALGLTNSLLEKINFSTEKNKYFSKIISGLKKNKRVLKEGWAWDHVSNAERSNRIPMKSINLSLSHGVAGIIIIICKILKNDIEVSNSTELIKESIKFLLSKKSEDKNTFPLYPILCNINGITISENPRLAWCYGDLGIAVAVWQAGKALENEEWQNEAIGIMLNASKRRGLEQSGVIDAGICHGTAGIAHIFNRFYKETNIKEFDDARWYWLEQTLSMSKFKDGLYGYKAWQINGWRNEYGLLEGISGIGMVLLGFLTDDINDLNWDSCLLLS